MKVVRKICKPSISLEKS